MVSRMVLESDAVRCFGVFADHLNFTRAAEALHLSQPSLHTKIQGLQRDLGVPLYRRAGRRLHLTVAGHQVATYARDSARRAQELLATMDTAGRTVSLAAGRATCQWVIADGLRRIAADGYDLRLTTTDRAAAVRAVVDGQADLAVVAHEPPPAPLRSRRLATYPQVVLLPADHRLATRPQVSIGDLDGERLVVPPAERPHRRALDRALADVGATCAIGAEVDGWSLQAQLVDSGMGIAVVNGCVQVPDRLVSRTVSDLPQITYWSTWRPERTDLVAETLDLLHR
jgi:LysR family transcriptional regulator, low CO2-responsive transcriptional regulator